MITRRKFLASGVVLGALAGVPILVPSRAADGYLELRAQITPTALVPGNSQKSDTWFFDGQTPGPEIRTRQGERLRVRLINELDQPTSIHWHGVRIDNAMDGVSGLTQKPVQPGDSFDYDFVVPDAGTFWYHSHHRSWEQVARGLYGPLIVEEAQPTFDIDHDITLMLDDWWLDQDGALRLNFDDYLNDGKQGGRIGNHYTMNGKPLGGEFPVTAGEAYRLRVINAANARIFDIDPTQIGAQLIAKDGQPVPENSREINELVTISPAQRVDLLFQPKPGPTAVISDPTGTIGQSDDNVTPLIKFPVQGDREQTSPVRWPAPNELIQPNLIHAKRVELLMEGGAVGELDGAIYHGLKLTADQLLDAKQVWTFNNVANLPNEPLFRSQRGETIIVKMRNQTGWQHAMHVHGHHFLVLNEDHSGHDGIWYDTFLVDRMKSVSIAFVTDNLGRWLLHCHMLQHATAGMRTWFEVV